MCLLNKEQEARAEAMFVTGSNLKLRMATYNPGMRGGMILCSISAPLPLNHPRGSPDTCMGVVQQNVEIN